MKKYIAMDFAPLDKTTLTYQEIDEDKINQFIQDREIDKQDEIHGYSYCFVVDADRYLIIKPTLKEAINEGTYIWLDNLRARYQDGFRSDYEEMCATDYASWLMPFLKMLRDMTRHPKPGVILT